MMNNKHGPNAGFTGRIRSTWDDPDIGRFKRGKERAVMLIVNRLTGEIQSE